MNEYVVSTYGEDITIKADHFLKVEDGTLYLRRINHDSFPTNIAVFAAKEWKHVTLVEPKCQCK